MYNQIGLCYSSPIKSKVKRRIK
ncbi:hypothetical protein D299_gp229 [Escherichia phage HX01]|nr:hypothetical protein D299_gp229 [Escherichia phage HX01]